MTIGGWLVMCLSVSSVTGLFAWCIWRVLQDPQQTGHVHGFDLHTPDESSGAAQEGAGAE